MNDYIRGMPAFEDFPEDVRLWIRQYYQMKYSEILERMLFGEPTYPNDDPDKAVMQYEGNKDE